MGRQGDLAAARRPVSVLVSVVYLAVPWTVSQWWWLLENAGNVAYVVAALAIWAVLWSLVLSLLLRGGPIAVSLLPRLIMVVAGVLLLLAAIPLIYFVGVNVFALIIARTTVPDAVDVPGLTFVVTVVGNALAFVAGWLLRRQAVWDWVTATHPPASAGGDGRGDQSGRGDLGRCNLNWQARELMRRE